MYKGRFTVSYLIYKIAEFEAFAHLPIGTTCRALRDYHTCIMTFATIKIPQKQHSATKTDIFAPCSLTA
jgi:hypothetical protein